MLKLSFFFTVTGKYIYAINHNVYMEKSQKNRALDFSSV